MLGLVEMQKTFNYFSHIIQFGSNKTVHIMFYQLSAVNVAIDVLLN